MNFEHQLCILIFLSKIFNMSRGFVREGDQEEAPIIPPRAALPEGTPNYVTPTGLDLLLDERTDIERQMETLTTTESAQQRRELLILREKFNQLQQRISSARIVDLTEQPPDEIRFGAKVTYRIPPSRKPVKIQITGVDEADIRQRKIAFIAPIAKAITGHRAGDIVDFQPGNELRKLEILKIEY